MMNNITRRGFAFLLTFSVIIAFTTFIPCDLYAGNATTVYTNKAKSNPKRTGVSKKKSSKTNGRKKKSKQDSSKENSQSTEKSTQNTRKGPRIFEGQLLYVSNEFANKTARVLALGSLFNGNRTYFVTVKGDEVDLYDATLYYHQIIKPKQKTAIFYSDLTKKGVVVSGEYFNDIYKVFGDQVKSGDKIYNKKLECSIKDNSVSYKGDNCKIYTGLITQSEAGDTPFMEIRGELWMIPELKANDVLKSIYSGFDTGAIVKKGIINTQARVPIIGSIKMQMAFELIGINERPVQDSELNPPADVILSTAHKGGRELSNYNKEHNKALKEAGLKPKDKKAKEVKKAISEQWDFANDWDVYAITPPKNDYSLWQFAEKIVSGLSKSTSKIWDENGDVTDKAFESVEEFKEKEIEDGVKPEMSEEEKQKIIEKNREIIRKDNQRHYDHCGKSAQTTYDTYAKFHNSHVKELIKDYKKDGHFSQITIGSSNRTFLDYSKKFRSYKDMMRRICKHSAKLHIEIKKHKAHDLEFEFDFPIKEAESELRRQGWWHH